MSEVNHHNDATGLVASAAQATGAKPYLGDIHDIDQMLRLFTEGVTSRFEQVGKGLLTPNNAADADRAACLDMAKVFCGQDDGYASIVGWNGKGLADYVRTRMGESVQPDEDDVQIVAQAFATFVHYIYGAITQHGNAEGTELVDALQENIRSFTWLLIGLESNE